MRIMTTQSGRPPRPRYFYGENVNGGTELEDMKSRYNSFFLRRKFDCQDRDAITSMTLRAKVDDGFVAYINGTEVARYNIETDKPKYNTLASKAATEPLRFRSYALKNFGDILADGENTIAVIVLNQRRTSPDALFDARLTAVSVESVPPKVKTVDPPSGLASSLGQVSVTFSEPVNGVDAADLLANGTPARLVEGSGRTWVFQLGDLPHGKVSLSWAKGHGITDQAQTPNTFRETANGNRWAYTYADDNPPHVRRANPPAGLTVKSLDTVEVEFSIPVSGGRRHRPAGQRQAGEKRDEDQQQPLSVCAWPSPGRGGENLVGSTGLYHRHEPFQKTFRTPWLVFITWTPMHRRRRESSSPKSCTTPSRSRSLTHAAGRCSTYQRMCMSSLSCTISAANR